MRIEWPILVRKRIIGREKKLWTLTKRGADLKTIFLYNELIFITDSVNLLLAFQRVEMNTVVKVDSFSTLYYHYKHFKTSCKKFWTFFNKEKNKKKTRLGLIYSFTISIKLKFKSILIRFIKILLKYNYFLSKVPTNYDF